MNLDNLLILNILNSGISFIMGFYMFYFYRNSYKLGTGYWAAGSIIIGIVFFLRAIFPSSSPFSFAAFTNFNTIGDYLILAGIFKFKGKKINKYIFIGIPILDILQTIIFFKIYPSPRMHYGLHSLPLIVFGLLAMIEMIRLNSSQKYLRNIFLVNSFSFFIYLFLLFLFDYVLIKNPNFDPLKITNTSIYMQIITAFLLIALTFGFLSAVNVRLNKELEDQRNQLIQSKKLASVGILAAGIAHEINNPVNYISGGISALKKSHNKLAAYLNVYKQFFKNSSIDRTMEPQLPDDQQIELSLESSEDMFKTIEEGIDKTTKIVQSIRGFSSKSENVFAEFDIHETIDNILLMLFNKYKNRIKIVKEYAPHSKIMGVSVNIQQIIMNLLINAIQAIPEKGTIWIKTQADKTNNHFIISIKDDGIGIPLEIQDKLFDPFFSTKDVGKGTGLGLYLTYTFVEQHHGSIKVISEPGKGAEFIVELPVTNKENG